MKTHWNHPGLKALGLERTPGDVMITVVIGAIFVGAVLSLRYRVFVLIPSIILACVVVSCAGILWGISASQIALEIVALTTALQLGYVAPFNRLRAYGLPQ